MANYQLPLAVVFFLSLLGISRASEQPNEVTFGFFVMKPYAYLENGSPKGVVVDFLQEVIGPEMGIKVNFVNMPLARILREVETGNLDGIVILGHTKERSKFLVYPQNYTQKAKPVIAVKASHELNSLQDGGDISKLIVGYVKDAILTPFVARYAKRLDYIHGHQTWGSRDFPL